ncbi:MAG: hypothetical protein MUO67_15660, partial [Anaerolineales bacterium]|nr:hypothetical protein [Anaerolineales bacterium]
SRNKNQPDLCDVLYCRLTTKRLYPVELPAARREEGGYRGSAAEILALVPQWTGVCLLRQLVNQEP